MYKPTYEELVCATRINAFLDETAFWLQIDKDPNAPASLFLNINDCWEWASADCEQIKWEHIFLFEEGLKLLEKDNYRNSLLFSLAYVSISDNAGEPKNLFTRYHYNSEARKYSPINEISLKAWEFYKNWWKDKFEKESSKKESERMYKKNKV